MSVSLIAVVSILYIGVCISLLTEGRFGLSLFCFGCSLANVGLILDVSGK